MLKIEAGKRYVRRDGSVTPPLMVDPFGFEEIVVVVDPEREYVYSSEEGDERGAFVFSFRDDESDLVAAYEGEEE